MADHSRRDRVGIGLIGLGPSWEQRYRETLLRMQNRLTIRQVYDPVEARAKSVASEFTADVAPSLSQILCRPGVQGLLVLDPGWLGAGALQRIASCGKQIFLAHPALQQSHSLKAILKPAFASSTTSPPPNPDQQCIPELGLRFTPSACRLRELIATRLGSVRSIQIECDLGSNCTELAHLVDWCISLIAPPCKSMIRNPQRQLSERQIALEFPPLPFATESPYASLQQLPPGDRVPRFTIVCQRGTAIIANRTQISWTTSTERANESLADERSEIEILIDQFCRRAMGGLNPVGRLSEFLRAIEIVETLDRSVCSHGLLET